MRKRIKQLPKGFGITLSAKDRRMFRRNARKSHIRLVMHLHNKYSDLVVKRPGLILPISPNANAQKYW